MASCHVVAGLEILRYEEGWLAEGRHDAALVGRRGADDRGDLRAVAADVRIEYASTTALRTNRFMVVRSNCAGDQGGERTCVAIAFRRPRVDLSGTYDSP